MMAKNKLRIIRILSVIFVLFIPVIVSGQCRNGKVLCSETEEGIGYASIGIVGKNVGTVCDDDGDFTLDIGDTYNEDSLRVSMIGYEPKYIPVKLFKRNQATKVYLKTKSFSLDEVKIIYHRGRKVTLGVPVFDHNLRSGFDNNSLGSEMGIKVKIGKKVKLKDLNLNVARCTYDSVTYRLNIYREAGPALYENILSKPIYISFTDDDVGAGKTLSFDLSEYSIVVEGNILIALELYKDLGEGKLLFDTQFFTGITYHRKTSEGTWVQAPGAIGMYLDSNQIR